LVESRVTLDAGRPERFKGAREPMMVYRLLAVSDDPRPPEAERPLIDVVDR
jgi:hypothetical protein